MPSNRKSNCILDFQELDRLYLGDRELLRLSVDFLQGEARLDFDSAAMNTSSGPPETSSQVELEHPTLVLSGLQGFATSPAGTRAESIVLRWSFKASDDGVIVELLVIGDPEPVTLTLSCKTAWLEG
jgi:hypothetical protein